MKFVGTPVSAGVVVGKTYLYERFVPEISALAVGNPVEDATHYAIAQDTAQKELEGLRHYFAEANDSEKAAIFAAHLEILADETMDEEIRNGISEGENSGSWIIHSVYEQYARMFEQLDDPLIRERAVDLRDVCALAALLGGASRKEPLRSSGAGYHCNTRSGPLGHSNIRS